VPRCPGRAHQGPWPSPLFKALPRTPGAHQSCSHGPSARSPSPCRCLRRLSLTAPRPPDAPLLRRFLPSRNCPGTPRCGKEHRRSLFPLFPTFPHARFLAEAPRPRATAVHPSPTSVLPTRASRRDPCSARVLPVQLTIETEPGRPFTAKCGESAAVCRRRRRPAPPPRAASQSRPSNLDPTVYIRSRPGSNNPIPVNPRIFCTLAPEFYRNQPAVQGSSKVFTNRSFFFCLSPYLFLK
jgi:hypothetical protein